jgi:flagellar hook protein FlgE
MSIDNQVSAPEATTDGYFSGILDKNDKDVASDDGYVVNLSFYDDLGYSYTAKFALTEHEVNNKVVDGQYDIELTDILDMNGYSILYDENGNYLTGMSDAEKAKIFQSAVVEYNTSDGTFTQVVSGGLTGDSAKKTYTADDPRTTIDLTLSHANLFNGSTQPDANGIYDSQFKDITIELESSLNYNNGGTSTLGGDRGKEDGGDGAGKKVGALIGLTVNNDGRIFGSYSNGNTVLLCQIATAQFSNASGLEKVGENCYKETLNSGEFDGIGTEITADGSSISAGELEMSNVDLSSEFTSMIVTQRGFQANSRVITTSDTLLEELVNLKR